MKFKKNLVVVLSVFVLAACGQVNESADSLRLKEVPVEDDAGSNNQSSTVDETDPVVDEQEEKEETMSFRDKVLMNSDLSETALDNAIEFYDQNLNKISNKSVISIFDVTKHSGKRRLYVINTKDGSVEQIHVAHGKNSDTDHDGYATSFSNQNGSNQSSLGFMITAETYYGKNGYSLKLDGQEARNSKVRARYVVIHGADYVNPDFSKMGRSLGCPAVSRANTNWYIDKVKNGSLLYIYHAGHDG